MMILGMEEHHLTVFACVGLAVVATRVLGAFLGLYKAFLRPGKNLRKYGSWAVVTGATGG
jgi:17beta-estradiol 17-dehydrogenase / very-long-chain 3-oxoacyl-CoA reductase